MSTRLVLGCGGVGRGLIDSSEKPDEWVVVCPDPTLVETLREERIQAVAGDPTDRTLLAGLDVAPSVVFVAGDRSDQNVEALECARDRFPDAVRLVYAGDDPAPPYREAMDDLAHLVVDPATALAERVVTESATPRADNARLLRRQLRRIDGRLAIVMHDNPDPDAIASAVALADIAAAMGVEAEPCYYGEISHQENRAMVNLLEFDLRNLDLRSPLDYEAFALVDHSRPGVNDQLPPDLTVDIVIDHHPPRGPVSGRFVDLREMAGATSTVLTEYLERLVDEIDPRTATALLFGIRVDTKDFTREVSALDFSAAATLLPHVDTRALNRIEEPTVDGETMNTIARAIKNRSRHGSVVVSSAGEITSRDALPQAADQLLTIEGVRTTLVFGFMDQQVFLSARSRGGSVDLGETMRDAFAPIGSAGGHSDMAGAQLEIGVLGGVEDDDIHTDAILSAVEEVVRNRFLESIDSQPGTPVGSYTRESELLFSPGGPD